MNDGNNPGKRPLSDRRGAKGDSPREPSESGRSRIFRGSTGRTEPRPAGKNRALIAKITDCQGTDGALVEPENIYRTLFENAGVAIVNLDAQGNYLHANEHYLEFIGYSWEELKNRPMTTEILHPDYVEEANPLIEQQKCGRIKGFTHEMYFIRKDGTRRWGEVRSATNRDRQGRLLSIVVAITDRTERKKAEDKLKRYAEAIRDLYENAPCGYHSLAEDGTILRMNDTELSWLGYSRDEVIGKMNYTDLIPADQEDAFRKSFTLLKRQGSRRNIEGELIRKNGDVLSVLIESTAVYDQDGRYLLSRSSVFDNTERKRVEKALAESEAIYRNLFENASIGMCQFTMDGKLLRINKAYARMLGYDSTEEVLSIVTDSATQIHADPRNREELLSALNHRDWVYAEHPYRRKDGSIMIGKATIRKVVKQDGATAYLEGIVEDITERKQAEAALAQREKELRIKAQNLMEVNTTLNVLLNTLERDQEELKERFLLNIQKLVLPYLDRLKESPLRQDQLGCLQTAEAHLMDIASPFAQRLTSSFLNLTKTEVQIACLVKEGKTSKEIAELLNAKQRVIEFHRENIRMKLGLKNKKGRLAMLLRSFA